MGFLSEPAQCLAHSVWGGGGVNSFVNMWGEGTPPVLFSGVKVSPWTWSLPPRVGWLASEPQKSSCLPPHHWDYKCGPLGRAAFMGSGNRTQVLSLHGEHFTSCVISSTPADLLFITRWTLLSLFGDGILCVAQAGLELDR